MTTEQKALALVNEVRALEGRGPTSLAVMNGQYSFNALCRAIEAHEADKKAFSDVAKKVVAMIKNGESYNAIDLISPFILPEPELDPLVEAMSEAMCGVPGEDYTQPAKDLRQALAARGYKIAPKEADNG